MSAGSVSLFSRDNTFVSRGEDPDRHDRIGEGADEQYLRGSELELSEIALAEERSAYLDGFVENMGRINPRSPMHFKTVSVSILDLIRTLRFVARAQGHPACFCFLVLVMASLCQVPSAQGVNLGLAGKLLGMQDGLALFQADELANGKDLNGDGDQLDLVIHVYDTRTGILTNLGVASDSSIDDNDWNESLFAFYVPESEQGGLDLNGDGDTTDDVLMVYDVSGRQVLGYQGSGELNSLVVCESVVLFKRIESDSGPLDLNGDGDTLDTVAHIFSKASGLVANTGLASNNFQGGFDQDLEFIAGKFVVEVIESFQGGTDLNGDGDTTGRVPIAYDPQDGSTFNLGLEIIALDRVGRLGILEVSEFNSERDLNDDGDQGDLVLFVYDGDTRSTQNLRSAVNGLTDIEGGEQGKATFLVSELSQRQDLNGDGDIGLFETVAAVYDRSTGLTTNLGIATSGVVVDYPWAAALVVERWQEVSLNGDNDQLDNVLHLIDLRTGSVTNLGIASQILEPRNFEQGLLVFAVREADQNLEDLNGDGDSGDIVLHVLDAATGVVTSVGLAITAPQIQNAIRRDNGRIVVRVDEQTQGGTDFNSDGDALDGVVFAYDPCSLETVSTLLATQGTNGYEFEIAGDVVVMTAFEPDQGIDLNGDGDLLDSVLHVLDLGLNPLGYQSIGTGLGGSGGLVPELFGVGCASSGRTAGLLVTSGLEGAPGVLIIGDQEVSLSIFGGELLVFPFELLSGILLDGLNSLPGSGDSLTSFVLSDPSLAGLTMICQAGLLDPGAAQGVSLTPGVSITFGD